MARQIRKCLKTKDAMKLTEEFGLSGVRPDWNSVALDKVSHPSSLPLSINLLDM
jgi:hypothetical protein